MGSTARGQERRRGGKRRPEEERGGWEEKGEKGGGAHLLLQLRLGQQLGDEVQADVDGGDACHGEGQQGLGVALGGDGPRGEETRRQRGNSEGTGQKKKKKKREQGREGGEERRGREGEVKNERDV